MSKKEKKESFFWTSYSDLMTSMFFVMLLLFVLVVALQQRRVVEGQTKIDQYEKLLELEKQYKELESSSDFQYIEEKRMFVAKDFQGDRKSVV